MYSLDSRLTKKGDLFFALSGERVDGHDFLEDVAKKGARAAVVLESYDGPEYLPLIRVPDVLLHLQEMARERVNCPVVAITGTLGKTTTKDFVAALLSNRFRVHATPKSYNSKRTLPLTILQAPEDTEILVLEMGMSEPGEIRRLCEIAPPTVALLLSVEPNRPNLSLEEIALAKAEIFENAQHGIIAKHLVDLVGDLETFGIEGEPPSYWKLPGKHNYHNFLGACAVARHFGITEEEIANTELTLPPQRMETHVHNGVTIIDDAYNCACAASAIAALDNLPQVEGKRIAVMSEIDDIGIHSEASHLKVAKHALSKVDLLLCIGEESKRMCELWQQEGREAHYFTDREQLLNKIQSVMQSGDVVLFKGSRTHALEKVVRKLCPPPCLEASILKF